MADKPEPKRGRYKLSAEHMRSETCRVAIAEAKKAGAKRVSFKADEIFTGFFTFKITGTTKEVDALREAIWQQNGGACCELTKLAKA